MKMMRKRKGSPLTGTVNVVYPWLEDSMVEKMISEIDFLYTERYRAIDRREFDLFDLYYKKLELYDHILSLTLF